MATTAEQNAAFDVVHREVVDLINQKGGFFSGRMMAALESSEGRAVILRAVKDALIAAERVRAREEGVRPK